MEHSPAVSVRNIVLGEGHTKDMHSTCKHQFPCTFK